MKKILFTISIQVSIILAQNYPFKSGELLIYEVNLNIISAGKASLEIKDDGKLNGSNYYHIIFNNIVYLWQNLEKQLIKVRF